MGHAYGHNLIAEVGAAAAVGLKAALENQTDLPVKITVLGTPAEECFGGKVELIEAGAFADIDLVFMAHPAQQDVSFLPGVAISAVTVKYLGKASHASAYPWEGVNALDAAVLAYNNLSVLRLQLRPEWRLHEIICSTHSHYNILPNATLAKLYEENGEALGIQFAEQTNPISASTDFGNVSFIVPGIHPCFYICTDAFNHTKEYTKAAGAEEAQLYTLRTAKALAMTAVDVVCSPDLLRQVREDFRLAKLKQDVRLKGTDAALRDSLTHLTLIISLEKGCKRYFITDEFVKVVLSLNSL